MAPLRCLSGFELDVGFELDAVADVPVLPLAAVPLEVVPLGAAAFLAGGLVPLAALPGLGLFAVCNAPWLLGLLDEPAAGLLLAGGLAAFGVGVPVAFLGAMMH